jgi:hypothetical protein
MLLSWKMANVTPTPGLLFVTLFMMPVHTPRSFPSLHQLAVERMGRFC